MKKVRKIICLLFVVACAVTALYYVKVKMVEDTVPPEIICENDTIEISVKDDPSALMEGMTATDNRDGDITDSIRVDYMSHFVNGPKRFVNYVVFDKANQAGTMTRTVIYKDYKPTKIKVKKPFLFMVNSVDSADLYEYIEAEDCLDGDITNQVRTIFEAAYTGEPGIYTLTLEVSNSAGDLRAIPMEVVILDNADDDATRKQYPLLKDYILYTKVGKAVKPEKNIIGLWQAGREILFSDFEQTADDESGEGTVFGPDMISYSTSEVDYSKPGIYPITYSYTAEGASKAKTTCYVVVEEKTNE